MSTLYFDNQTTSKKMEFYVYLAGVEVPCESVNVNVAQGRFLEFSITIPPDPLLYRLGADDRVPAAVFYLDHYTQKEPTLCLLCEGEITGWAYSRTGQNRSMTLSVVDPIAVLTQLFIHFISDVDSALGANAGIKSIQSQGNVVTLNTLPLAFMYQFLNPKGPFAKPVSRPVDILLNILSSITGYANNPVAEAANSAAGVDQGVKIFSNQIDLARTIEAAKKTADASNKVTGDDIYSKAKTLVDVGVYSPVASKQGPREFSKIGLMQYVLSSLSVSSQPFSSAQELYSQCVSAGTVQPSNVLRNIPGVLMFESETNSIQSITSVAIVGKGGKAIEVIDSEKALSSDDGFMSAHTFTAVRHESRGVAGLYHADVTGKGAPAGISMGLMQHNQKYGTLYEICVAMRASDPATFDGIMGGDQGLAVFLGSKAGFRAYDFQSPSVKEYWKSRFSTLFEQFVHIQYEFDKETYYKPALRLAQQYEVNSETGAAMFYDAYIQIGERSMKAILTLVDREAGNDKNLFLERFAYYADRQGRTTGSWLRRNRILNHPKFSRTKFVGGATLFTAAQPGVRELPTSESWRKPVAYALIPGVDYSKYNLLKDPAAAVAAKADGSKRLEQLKATKSRQLSDIAYSKYSTRDFNKLSPTQTRVVEKLWESKYGATHQKRVDSSLKEVLNKKTTAPAFDRAKIAIMFFMRWLQKTKLREKIIASPYLEGVDVSQGIFPVLSAMSSENTANALVQYLQQTNARSGSMWDFLSSTYNLAMWDLLNIAAPPSVMINQSHEVTSLYEATKQGTHAITSYISKPLSYFGLPPSCNVYFPSMYEQLNFQENYATQPTRTYIDDSTSAKMLGMDANSPLTFYASGKAAYPASVDNKLFEELAKRKPKNSKDVVVFPEELYKGPVTNRLNTPTWFYFLYKNSGNKSNAANTTGQSDSKIIPKLVGTKAVYTRGSQSFELPYVDDAKASTTTGGTFTQQGYFQGTPIKFSAINVDGQIVHEILAKELFQARADAKKAGIDITVAQGYRTAGEQVLLADGKDENRPGYSLAQSGAQVVLSVNGKNAVASKNWLVQNGFKYGFILSTTSQAFILISRKAVDNAGALAQKKAPVISEKSPRRRLLQHSQYVMTNIRVRNTARASKAQNTVIHDIYFKYAKYEHYREKYSSRVASLSGVFNPYVIPGFPIFIFDKDRSDFFIVGYVTSLSHTLSNGGMAGTSLQLTHVRTFNEMFETLVIDGETLGVSPSDPIKEVSDRLQKFKEARAYYKKLLYGDEDFQGKDPLGDYQQLLGYANNNAIPDPIRADATDTQGFNINSEYDRELAPLESAKQLFEDTNAALKYCARPVCTIEEYIDFYNGVRNLSVAPGDSINRSFTNDTKFYYRIREFPFGEGIEESNDPTVEGLSELEQYKRISKLPATLRDWQKVLLIYRQKIYSNQTDV